MNRNTISLTILSAICAMSGVATADTVDWAEGKLTYNANLVGGTTIRMDNADPALLSGADAKMLGLTGTAPGGVNGNDGDLNFKRHQQVSTVLKFYGDLDYSRQNYGIHVGAKAWDDFALDNQIRPWGNLPNNYAMNTPLSDTGAANLAKFTGGLEMTSLYLYGQNQLFGNQLSWKVGEQNWDWGTQFHIGGGLNDLLVRDYNGMFRPGALPEEGLIPVPAVRATYALTQTTSLDAIFQTRFRANGLPECGTFYSQADFTAPGCDKVVVGPNTLAAPTQIAKGLYVNRGNEVEPGNGSQGGVGIHEALPSIDSTVGLYAAEYDSRQYFYGAYKSTGPLAFNPKTPATNPLYALEYPGGIHLYGLSYDFKHAGTTFAAELTYRPDMPFHYNSNDLLNAFASYTAPTQLRAAEIATPKGGLFSAYQRMKEEQLNLSVGHSWDNVALADRFTLSAEASVKEAPNLPDPSVLRFGRSLLFGNAPLNGAPCPANQTALQCTNAGYDTKMSWGYRAHVNLNYLDVMPGIDFKPTLTFIQDVKGWSDDGMFSQGRMIGVLDLKVVAYKNLTIDLVWAPTWGGDFNPLVDRSTMSLSMGYRF